MSEASGLDTLAEAAAAAQSGTTTPAHGNPVDLRQLAHAKLVDLLTLAGLRVYEGADGLLRLVNERDGKVLATVARGEPAPEPSDVTVEGTESQPAH